MKAAVGSHGGPTLVDTLLWWEALLLLGWVALLLLGWEALLLLGWVALLLLRGVALLLINALLLWLHYIDEVFEREVSGTPLDVGVNREALFEKEGNKINLDK